MVNYHRFTLANGLRVIFHQDPYTPMATVSLLYDVGSKDESPEKTGFTHLFEHLMFSGSLNAPNFDDIIQGAGGENNAYTNSDMTHFYNILPKENVETALFLEADRMQNLIIDNNAFLTQRSVVLEEFNETCFNQPYGDVWHHMLGLAYTQHPYQWPTIGLKPEHIAEARIDDVIKYFHSHYLPSNAILSIGGNLEIQEVEDMVQKHFGSIPSGETPKRTYLPEPKQSGERKKVVEADVPSDSLYLAFKMADRTAHDYYAQDLITDLLANGSSSRLISKLVNEDSSFVSIDAYVYGTSEPGLLFIEGQPSEDHTLEEAEKMIWSEIDILKNEPIPEPELRTQLNKVRTNLILSETSVLGKTMSLAYYELLNDIDLINKEDDIYGRVTASEIQEQAKAVLTKENCCTVYYKQN